MIIPFYEEIDKKYKKINLVNQDDIDLRNMGLKPVDIRLYPQYINLNGNIYYGGNNHYNCRLSDDIKSLLGIMNSNNYDRFTQVNNFLNDNYEVVYYIYNNEIFFPSTMSLFIYEKLPSIRNEINNKYQVKPNYYKPTSEEIFFDYFKDKIGEENFYRCGSYIRINLTPKEYLEYRMSIEKEELKKITDSSKLTGEDIRIKLNYNANLFMQHKINWDKTGIYNDQCMDLINSFQETKRDIYESLYKLANKSNDMKQLVVNLLKTTSCYHEIKEQTPEEYFEDPYYEMCEWGYMYFLAHQDILVSLIGFDKIETTIPKTISTTKVNINETFFNYLIMDYNIVQLPKLVYNQEHNNFKWIKPNPYIQTSTEKEYEEEIKLIKKYIPYSERTQYFK